MSTQPAVLTADRPHAAAPANGRGPIMPIGGAEDKLDDKIILSTFVHLAGGRDARLAIVPTASSIEYAGERYKALFLGMGAASADVVYIADREDANGDAPIELLQDATGIFLTGGNQMRLSAILGGTKAAELIRARNDDGAIVAGTSAGASILSSYMVAFGASGETPRQRMAQIVAGFSLVPDVIIDQHFRQRDRLGRLLTALAYNPFAIGIGLDENTSAFIAPDDRLEVVGGGALTIVDPSELEFSSMAHVRKNDPVCLIGLRLHVLDHGATFNIRTREASAAPVIAKRV
jgi:cyanophycinase